MLILVIAKSKPVGACSDGLVKEPGTVSSWDPSSRQQELN
ncbi:hypothetical protein Bra471DRAFT_00736 [Bradyrhizobium sp. WSM471]|nr:hypothetical protein Bra471DRAFT_00736 [Bradyrhizobium sp. WSM471]